MERNSVILIVDDEPFGRRTLGALLESPGYTLAFAHNGSEALSKAAELTPDLILLDVMMPDMDGFEVCRHLRADPHLAEVPVIMVTSLDDRRSRLRGIEAGADDIVSKPFDSVELHARVRTITRLNRYRRLLLERAKFERVTELAPDGIAIVNAHGHICLLNPALLHMLGGTDPHTIVGTHVNTYLARQDDLFPPHTPTGDTPNPAPTSTPTPTPTPPVARFETTLVRLDGTSFPVEVNTGSILWDDQPATQVIVRDMTRRKQVEEALRESERHLRRSRDVLRAIFDGLDQGLALLDSDDTILAINQAMSELLLPNSTPNTFVGHSWDTVCHRTTPPFPGQSVARSLHDNRPRRQRKHHTGPNGEHRSLDIHLLPLLGPEQRVEQLIVHVIDVTERLQLETLAIQNEHFAARGRLAATIAHEVNTPLQSIQNCLYLAGTSNDAQRDTYLGLAHDELERISTIVRQLLTLPPAANNQESGDININHLIDRVLLLTGGTLASYGIDVSWELVPDPRPVRGYADHLMQVFLNVILNAVDAMPDGGKLRIQTNIWDRHTRTWAAPHTTQPLVTDLESRYIMVIEVADTGKGMSAEVQSRVFEPFFTTKQKGTGVGLAICQRIIAQHGGHINVQSVVDNGSTFTLVLPIYETANEHAHNNP